MIARLLLSFGLSIAAVGFTIFGMATSYIFHDDDMKRTSYILMAGGILASVIGFVLYRAEENRAEAAIRVRADRQR